MYLHVNRNEDTEYEENDGHTPQQPNNHKQKTTTKTTKHMTTRQKKVRKTKRN